MVVARPILTPDASGARESSAVPMQVAATASEPPTSSSAYGSEARARDDEKTAQYAGGGLFCGGEEKL